jgi:hypothetical protein
MIVAPADTPVVYPPYLPSDLAISLDAYTFVRDVVVYDIPELPPTPTRACTSIRFHKPRRP